MMKTDFQHFPAPHQQWWSYVWSIPATSHSTKKKGCSAPPRLFLLSDRVGVSEGEVAATFIAPERWGGSECVFRLAHFIRGLGIATLEEEP